MTHVCVNGPMWARSAVFYSHACLVVAVWASAAQVFRNLW
jgi:hypothetical protein